MKMRNVSKTLAGNIWQALTLSELNQVASAATYQRCLLLQTRLSKPETGSPFPSLGFPKLMVKQRKDAGNPISNKLGNMPDKEQSLAKPKSFGQELIKSRSPP